MSKSRYLMGPLYVQTCGEGIATIHVKTLTDVPIDTLVFAVGGATMPGEETEGNSAAAIGEGSPRKRRKIPMWL